MYNSYSSMVIDVISLDFSKILDIFCSSSFFLIGSSFQNSEFLFKEQLVRLKKKIQISICSY